MKKLLALAIAVTGILAFAPIEAKAGTTYRSKVLNRCHHCGKNVYAFYRPTRYVGTRAVYGWVPSYHGSCGRSSLSHRSYGYSGSSFRFSFGTPSYRNNGYSRGYRYRSIPSVRTYRSYPSYRVRSYRYCR